ncbi:MAG: hypothetical protein ABRQ26_04035 [Syntrophomonadaceae bacterium]
MQLDKDKNEIRIIATENVSYAMGYKFTTLLLLSDILFRAWIKGEAAWDLMGLVLGSGLLVTLYQAKNRMFTPRWKQYAGLLLILLAAVAVLLLWGRR